MNRSTLLLLLFVFVISEMLLAAKMARIRGVAGPKDSSGMRLVRSANCPTDSQCNSYCKVYGLSGRLSDDSDAYCDCDGQIQHQAKRCVEACNKLGVGDGELEDEVKYHCDSCE